METITSKWTENVKVGDETVHSMLGDKASNILMDRKGHKEHMNFCSRLSGPTLKPHSGSHHTKLYMCLPSWERMKNGTTFSRPTL